MMFWIIAGAVCIVLFALAWWTSGRSKRAAMDPRRAMLKADAYSRSQETQVRFDPRGP
jgi:Flp pilus assembly protein TadB